jgi:nitroreductase
MTAGCRGVVAVGAPPRATLAEARRRGEQDRSEVDTWDVIALVLPAPADEHTRLIDQYDLGQATVAITIAATGLGIGTGQSSVVDQEKARAILGVPDDHLVALLLGIGYPADRPLTPIRTPDRRPFDEVVHRGHW